MQPRHGFVGFVAMVALGGWSACRSSPDPASLYAEAETLRLKYEKEASQQAIDRYRAALAVWKRRGDSRNAARASQGIGATYEQLGSLQASLQAYLEALPFAQQSPDRLFESEVLSDIGMARALVADRPEAFGHAEKDCRAALDIARRLGGPREEARALTCLGEAAYNNGDRRAALRFYEDASTLWNRLGDGRGLARSLLYQGSAHSDLSEFDRAQACFDGASSKWGAVGDARGTAITRVAHARLQIRLGDYQEALVTFNEALRLLQPMGDAVWEGAALTLVATVYLYLGDTAAALRHAERALQIFDDAGLKVASADELASLAEIYLASGNDTRALDRAKRALALATELGHQPWRANALRDIGVVSLIRRQPTEAIHALQESLQVQQSQSLGDRRLDARTHADLGDAHDMLGDHAAAAEHFTKALASSRATTDRAAEARALFGLGRASIGLNALDEARSHLARALSVVESLRTSVENRDLRASYVASIYQYHELYVEVLTRLDRLRPGTGLAAAAFEANERARARSLLESLAEANVDLRGGVDPALLKREVAVRQAFEAWGGRQRLLAGAAISDREARVLKAEHLDLEEQYSHVQAEIRSRSPRYAALTQRQPLSLVEVQRQVLDPGTLLLEYALGEKQSHLWAVSNLGHARYELPPRADIESAARRIYQLLTASLEPGGGQHDQQRRVERDTAEYWREAARLGEILLAPVTRKMAGKRLLIVADGALQYIPFAALPLPGRPGSPVPMVAEHEIVSLPSASVLAVLRRETAGRPTPPGAVAVLGDPVFEADDPRLRAAVRRAGGTAPSWASSPPADGVRAGSAPQSASRQGSRRFAVPPRLASTRQEADTIVKIASPQLTLKRIDFDASRAAAMDPGLGQYRIVHFATHGLFDNENPGLSGIFLSLYDQHGHGQAGFLSLRDIYSLRLPVELVVLSACNTALGKLVRGEGLLGMVRGFMYAGARRVVASLWKVDDEATGELMRRFYREMLVQGRSPAAALRQAQVDLWQNARWQPPFYWAAFVLQGEWR